MYGRLNQSFQKPTRVRRLFAIALVLFALVALQPRAHTADARYVETARDRAELHQALLDLTNPWTVMCIAAHPDDEDGATLTLLRRKYGVHTVSLFSTFGEGGQNAIGPELYEDLGVIRAHETIKAAEILGSEPHFLGLRDFGFSKSAEEAFRIWNRDEALRRMVLEIRQLRPDVIITNHDTVSGHGHHQATGRLVEEAFADAANPKRFPDQLETVSVWQPQRLFVRVNYESGIGSKQLEDEAARSGKIVSIDTNERDAVRGSTYAEQALQALQQHASQGPWPQTIPKEGLPIIRYRLARQSRMAAALPVKSKTVFDGLRLSTRVASRLIPPTIEGHPLTDFLSERQRVLEALIAARRAKMLSNPWSERSEPRVSMMNSRLQVALVKASGVEVTLKSNSTVLVPGTKSTYSVTVSNRGENEIHIRGGLFIGPDADMDKASKLDLRGNLSPQKSMSTTIERETPLKTPINIPHAAHLYDDTLLGARYSVGLMFDIAGRIIIPLSSASRIDVTPSIEIASIIPSPLVLTPQTIERSSTLTVRLFNHRDVLINGEITAGGPNPNRNKLEGGLVETFGSRNNSRRVQLHPNETREVKFVLGSFELEDSARHERLSFPNLVSFTVTSANSTEVITKQKVHVVYSDARVTANLRVGYVRSFDDTLRNALNALGVEARELTIEDIRAGDLQTFDTIIIDNRGYQAHPELVAANTRLLDYVKNGGTLLVFYHKANEWNPDPSKNRPQLAPYPITLGSERVTDENADVKFIEPQHALLNFPNKINTEDFNDWKQERGLYYPQKWDTHYEALLSMSDPGEAPLLGGLLTTEYGKGRYIYTSMVWYRQLRAGVPGAYRMFANMISYGRWQQFRRWLGIAAIKRPPRNLHSRSNPESKFQP